MKKHLYTAALALCLSTALTLSALAAGHCTQKSYESYKAENAGSGLGENALAAYYYDEHQYQGRDFTEDFLNQIRAQYDRISANPTPETAKAEMLVVEVPVWKLSNGEKVSSTARIEILSSLSEDVQAIFTEIYNGPEKFPINSVSGYQWRGNDLNSLHSSGCAIDINPNENPQMAEDGSRALVGNRWEPGINPYSIRPDGDVCHAFGARGWGCGAGFRQADYMHFEF